MGYTSRPGRPSIYTAGHTTPGAPGAGSAARGAISEDEVTRRRREAVAFVYADADTEVRAWPGTSRPGPSGMKLVPKD